MMKALVYVVLSTLLISMVYGTKHSVAMGRNANKFHPGSHGAVPHTMSLGKYVTSSGRRAGSSIPLPGGVLTIGTYFLNISVGTPSRNYNVLFDTGSSNLAIPSAMVRQSQTVKQIAFKSATCAVCSPLNYFSSTSKCVFGQPVSTQHDTCGLAITYGGGSSGISGELVSDRVCIGGNCGEAVFGSILKEFPADSFSGPGYDGIIGFASEFNSCNPTCVPPMLEALPGKKIFGNCLSPHSGGVLDLGFVDVDKIAPNSKLWYTDLIRDSWYNIQIDNILVGGNDTGVTTLFTDPTNDVIGSFPDSGTSLVLVGPEIFNLIKGTFVTWFPNAPQLTALFNGECVPDNGLAAKYPPVLFQVKDIPIMLELPASSYLFPCGQNQVALGIAAVPSIGVILGDLFLENYYTVYDRENLRVGFAPLREGSCHV